MQRCWFAQYIALRSAVLCSCVGPALYCLLWCIVSAVGCWSGSASDRVCWSSLLCVEIESCAEAAFLSDMCVVEELDPLG